MIKTGVWLSLSKSEKELFIKVQVLRSDLGWLIKDKGGERINDSTSQFERVPVAH